MPYTDSRSGPGIDCPARLLRLPKFLTGTGTFWNIRPRSSPGWLRAGIGIARTGEQRRTVSWGSPANGFSKQLAARRSPSLGLATFDTRAKSAAITAAPVRWRSWVRSPSFSVGSSLKCNID